MVIAGSGAARIVTPVVAASLALGGCATFVPPQYRGEVDDFAGVIELPYRPDRNYAVIESSTTTTTAHIDVAGRRASGKFTTRESLDAHLSFAPNFSGYRTSVCIERYRVVPETRGPESDDLEVDVGELRFELQTDRNGRLLALDVDRSSSGWLGLTAEQKSRMNQFVDGWRNRRSSTRDLSGVYRQGEVRKLDTLDMSADFASPPENAANLEAQVFARAVGITDYMGSVHLVLEYWGDARFEAGVAPGQLDIGGYFLIDARTGAPSVWEEALRMRADSGLVAIAVDRSASGQMSALQGDVACISGSI